MFTKYGYLATPTKRPSAVWENGWEKRPPQLNSVPVDRPRPVRSVRQTLDRTLRDPFFDQIRITGGGIAPSSDLFY